MKRLECEPLAGQGDEYYRYLAEFVMPTVTEVPKPPVEPGNVIRFPIERTRPPELPEPQERAA